MVNREDANLQPAVTAPNAKLLIRLASLNPLSCLCRARLPSATIPFHASLRFKLA